MKPFDYNQFANGAKALMPDGRKVKFVALANLDIGYPVAVHIEGAMTLASISVTGKMPGKGDDVRLTMAPIKRTVFVNVYATRLKNEKNPGNHAATFDTAADAGENARDDAAGLLAVAVPVEIEE